MGSALERCPGTYPLSLSPTAFQLPRVDRFKCSTSLSMTRGEGAKKAQALGFPCPSLADLIHPTAL